MSFKRVKVSRILVYGYCSCFLLAAVFGCAAPRKEAKPNREVVRHKAVEKPKVEEGSLWYASSPLGDLFANPKARDVGDIVTISIVESSSASNNAKTDTSRGSSLTAGIDQLFGMEKWYPERYPHYSKYLSVFNKGGKAAVKGSLESAFKGDGATTRDGKMTAYITARVVKVLPNGNLMISGSREIMVNNETQFITLSGVIRQRDISPNNVILSTYISDARIAYSGTGVVDARQRPGWLANILNKIWPF